MDVAELEAKWRQRSASRRKSENKPMAAPKMGAGPKKKNKQLHRSGRPPWVIAKEQRERIAKMDDADRAKEIETLHRNAALEMNRRNAEPSQHIVNGEVLCIECGEAVEEGRLKAKPNAARCIECQQFIESREKYRG